MSTDPVTRPDGETDYICRIPAELVDQHADWTEVAAFRCRVPLDRHSSKEWDGYVASLAEDAGIDTSVCELCEEPLDDSEPWRRGMDGCGAHERCLKAWL